MSGGNTGPIVDTWWQTETGAIMISPLPGITATKPGSAMAPLPGISAKIVDDDANELGAGGSGYLVLDKPVTLFTVLHRRATVARPGMTPCPCLTHDPGGWCRRVWWRRRTADRPPILLSGQAAAGSDVVP